MTIGEKHRTSHRKHIHCIFIILNNTAHLTKKRTPRVAKAFRGVFIWFKRFYPAARFRKLLSDAAAALFSAYFSVAYRLVTFTSSPHHSMSTIIPPRARRPLTCPFFQEAGKAGSIRSSPSGSVCRSISAIPAHAP